MACGLGLGCRCCCCFEFLVCVGRRRACRTRTSGQFDGAMLTPRACRVLRTVGGCSLSLSKGRKKEQRARKRPQRCKGGGKSRGSGRAEGRLISNSRATPSIRLPPVANKHNMAPQPRTGQTPFSRCTCTLTTVKHCVQDKRCSSPPTQRLILVGNRGRWAHGHQLIKFVKTITVIEAWYSTVL